MIRVISLTVPLCVWLCMPSPGQAAFVSCVDAHNYGENSGRLYVSQTFARMDCDDVLLATVHNALARMLATQVLESDDSDDEKLCYFQGLWDGLVGQLSEEYAACGASPPFSCLERSVLSSDAGGLLRALSGTFDDASVLTNGSMAFVYGIEPSLLSGVPLCPPLSTASCADVVRSRAGPRVTARLNYLVEGIANLICD